MLLPHQAMPKVLDCDWQCVYCVFVSLDMNIVDQISPDMTEMVDWTFKNNSCVPNVTELRSCVKVEVAVLGSSPQ